MMSSMYEELQKCFEHVASVVELDGPLKDLFADTTRLEKCETLNALIATKMKEGSSVSAHVVHMIGLLERLSNLETEVGRELSITIILQSLPPSYIGFRLNYQMNHMDKLPSCCFDPV